MTAATLAEALAALPAYATDEILHICVRRLVAGDDPQLVLVETFEAFAKDRERLIRECGRLKQAEIPVTFFGTR